MIDVLPVAALRFVPETHSYYLGDRELISVTRVLQEAGLIDPQWFTEDAAMRGTYVHEAIALHHDDDLAMEALDPVLRPYVEGYLRFLSETFFDAMQIEQRVFSESLGYAGTFDVLGHLPSQPPGYDLIDVKSGGRPATVGLQLAAYVRCLPVGVHRRWCLQLPGDGSYRLHRCEDRTDEHVFLAALTVAKWKRANR